MPTNVQIRIGGSALRRAALAIALLTFATPVLHAQTDSAAVSSSWLDGLHAQLEELGLATDSTNSTRAVVLGLLREVDKKARSITPEEWEQQQNRRSGLMRTPGIILKMENGLPLIQSIASNAPVASMDKIGVDDTIVGIGTQRFVKIALPDAQRLLKKDHDQPVALHVIHRGETNAVTVERTELSEPSIELVELLPNNVGYMKVNGLYDGSGRDMVSRIRAWSETDRDGIIMDLRGAGGNDVASVIEIASLYAQDGQFLFAYRDLHQQDIEVAKALGGSQVSLPLMILIDRNTTGAAEVLAAVLNGTARKSLLIGEETRGNFNLREAAEISGHLVLVATRVLDTADGIRYNGSFGIQPSVSVDGIYRDTHDYEPPEDLLDHREKLAEEETDLETRRRVRGDGVLERAVDILTGLKSLNKAESELSSADSL